MLIFCRDSGVVPEDSIELDSSKTDERVSEGQKASDKRTVHDLVTFVLFVCTSGYLQEVKYFVEQIKGVESVNADDTSSTLEVTGRVDPSEIRKRVNCMKKRQVELVPSAQSESYGDKNRRPDAKVEEKNRQEDTANAKSGECVTVLKVKLDCESCTKKFKRILKDTEFKLVSRDDSMDLVTVKGSADVTELISTLEGKLKRDVEVKIPTKKDSITTAETGVTNKKKKNYGLSHKKGKGKGKGDGNPSVPNKVEDKDSPCISHGMNQQTPTVDSSRSENDQEAVNVSMNGYPYPYNQRPVPTTYYSMLSDDNPQFCTIL